MAAEQPKTVTFILTEECNLRCSYCYLVGKNSQRKMSFDVAKKAVDYLLENPQLFPEDGVIWDFIGGEPFLEVELIERIVERAQLRAYELDHPWFENHQVSITTNGTLYGSPAVQRLIRRFRNALSISVSVDGPQHVHDKNRLTKGGGGSYEQVVANVPLWLRQFPNASTKVTIDHDNLPFLCESVLHLFELGIRDVRANVVFENVWHPGDDLLLEQQLDALAEAMLSTGLYPKHSCSFFSRGIGKPHAARDDGNWCGTGKMLAIDADGRFYPCNRFVAFSLAKRQPRDVGDIEAGLDQNRLRPFLSLRRSAQSTPSCNECEVATGCAWCQGLNYDDADTPTIFQRATHLCAMHKARVRANDRFWARIDEATKTKEG